MNNLQDECSIEEILRKGVADTKPRFLICFVFLGYPFSLVICIIGSGALPGLMLDLELLKII